MDPATRTSDELAEQYRVLMRWYPARWRKHNESTVLSMLLDDADKRGLVAPTRADRLALVFAGLRERFFGFDPVPAFNHAALLAGVCFSFLYTLVIWAPGEPGPGSIGPFANPSVITAALVVVAWVLAAFRIGRTSQVLSWVAFTVNALIAAAAASWQWFGPSVWAAAVFALLTALGGIRMWRPRR